MSEEILLESGVSAKTGEPFVNIKWKDRAGQLTVTDARQHALAILECAEAAESDAFIIKFFRERVGLSQEKAAQVLIDFRSQRR
jgi:hypothetical protein